jgi:hypothetical protein
MQVQSVRLRKTCFMQTYGVHLFYSSLLDMGSSLSRPTGQLPGISRNTPSKSSPRPCLQYPKSASQAPSTNAAGESEVQLPSMLDHIPHPPLLYGLAMRWFHICVAGA